MAFMNLVGWLFFLATAYCTNYSEIPDDVRKNIIRHVQPESVNNYRLISRQHYNWTEEYWQQDISRLIQLILQSATIIQYNSTSEIYSIIERHADMYHTDSGFYHFLSNNAPFMLQNIKDLPSYRHITFTLIHALNQTVYEPELIRIRTNHVKQWNNMTLLSHSLIGESDWRNVIIENNPYNLLCSMWSDLVAE
eukprot:134015_1